MKKCHNQYQLFPGDLILSPPYLYFQIAFNMDLCITRDVLYEISTSTGNRVNITYEEKVLYDCDK